MNFIESEVLLELYWGNEYSTYKIAKIFNCNQYEIVLLMRGYSIPLRNRIDSLHMLKGRISPMKGKCMPIDAKEKIRIANIGKKYSIETIRKLSESHKGNVSGMKGKHHTEETKKKLSLANTNNPKLTGENSYRWNGGITDLSGELYNTLKYRQWRNAVYKRDKYICQMCKKIGYKLNAHNIKLWSKYPELRYIIDNGITLCRSCHNLLHKKKKRVR